VRVQGWIHYACQGATGANTYDRNLAYSENNAGRAANKPLMIETHFPHCLRVDYACYAEVAVLSRADCKKRVALPPQKAVLDLECALLPVPIHRGHWIQHTASLAEEC
jgi:hypothetical protein